MGKKYFVCDSGASEIPYNKVDTMGVIGELYWCNDDDYIRSPAECATRMDAEPIRRGHPANPNDVREIWIDQASFSEISEQEYTQRTGGKMENENPNIQKVPCQKCKELINKGAEKCPFCQSKQMSPAAAGFTVGCFVLIVIAVIIGMIGSCGDDKLEKIDPTASAEVQQKQADKLLKEAKIIAAQFVKERLKSPSTADFQYSQFKAVRGEGNQMVVKVIVDSQNSFGAMVRTQMIAVVEYQGDGKWTLVGLVDADQ
ncbi:MAG: hypothetical protein PHI85_09320 [Victivallaceae bacterium]|nr:hypothetical protein [Victivallaceae bacterium]